MSVPTTLQGTHDGCGGTVVFRPATHRRELLAGGTVTLQAVCRSCGATLTTAWRLPESMVRAESDARAQRAARSELLPLAAGAEEWHGAFASTANQHRPTARPSLDMSRA